MRLNSFSVRIPEGTEQDGGYIELKHNTQYSLVLRNSREVRCDAKVEIDGKQIGTWRLEADDSIRIDRPAHDTGRLTFYKLGSAEAESIGLQQGDPNLGLIKVTFTPEKISRPLIADVFDNYLYRDRPRSTFSLDSTPKTFGGFPKGASRGGSAGGTGLSGESSQKFGDASQIKHDLSQQTVIHLRLVGVKDLESPRPLTSFSTPVPPPIE